MGARIALLYMSYCCLTKIVHTFKTFGNLVLILNWMSDS